MKIPQVWIDERGTTAIEFGLTAPAFFAVLFGIIEFGLIMWTQAGLQHGAEMAARCASIDTIVCGNQSAIQNYAAQQAFGLNPSPSNFAVSTQPCGTLVSATYSFPILTNYVGGPMLALNAQSCFPK
jgi:Flp pilus assembly protein TadG